MVSNNETFLLYLKENILDTLQRRRGVCHFSVFTSLSTTRQIICILAEIYTGLEAIE